MNLKSKLLEAQVIAMSVKDNLMNQNLVEGEKKLQELKLKVADCKKTYDQLQLLNKISYTKAFYQDGLIVFEAGNTAIDGGLTAIQAVIPHTKILGLEGEGSFEGGSAENRIQLMIETLDEITPELKQAIDQLDQAVNKISQIETNKYPEYFKGQEVRSRIVSAKKTGTEGIVFIKQFIPVLEELPGILGGRGEEKKYFILFQNDNELRPTGGFLTAYAVVIIKDGKVVPEKSGDIYDLDEKFRAKETFPPSMAKYIKNIYKWNLRDMNINPDFEVSMSKFYENYITIPNHTTDIDGIISVDTNVLSGLLEVIGPVDVPGYGIFSAEIEEECDCPQVVYALSEIITKPTNYIREDRKGVLGPLMQTILQKTYSSPKDYMQDLLELAWTSLSQKNIQVYMFDEKGQAAMETLNGAGKLETPTNGEDFLAIINTNLAGGKSNLFVNYEVRQTAELPSNGQLKKKVEITYRNSGKPSNCDLEAGELCLNVTLTDWTRLYVPEGSQIVSSQGFLEDAIQYDEDGFTIIEGYFTLEPEGMAKVIVEYTIPYADTENYKVKIWKQGGVDPFKTLLDVTGGQEEVMVDKDILYSTAF